MPRRRRIPRRIHVVPLLSTRPKRGLSGYNLFIHENRGNVDPNHVNLIRELSSRWRELPQETKDQYNNRAQPDKNRHERQMTEWRRQRHVLQRPPTAFGIFLRECWKRWPNAGNSVRDMNMRASQLWRAKPRHEREQYHQLYRRMIMRHRTIIRQIRMGGGYPYNWKEEMFPEVQPAPQAPAPVQPQQPRQALLE